MRWAAARAASRRGSSMMTFRAPSQGASSKASGVTVVLPAPGGATRTALACSTSAAFRSSRTSWIGNMGRV